jgi:hypothetical protein
MKIKLPVPAFLLCVIISISCIGQKNAVPRPVPDSGYYELDKNESAIDAANIIEAKGGQGAMPEWFLTFIGGGIEAVERIDAYMDKYVFIAKNEGENFTSLSKWADNFSVVYDFPILAAARIEKRMILTSSLYPDDEYGLFFETMVLSAYNGEYPGTIKEDTYWIKIKTNNGNETGEIENNSTQEIYNFFILITIDKAAMRSIIIRMMTESFSAVTPSNAQTAAVNRLRQGFFDGF